MDYREFADAVAEQMERRMSGAVQVRLYTTVKNNGKERTGVLIEKTGINISPTIYLEEYYEKFLRGMTVEEIVEEIIGFYDLIRQKESWDCERILDFGHIKNRIVFKLINTERNREYLKSVPNLAFMDLSIVFYVLLEATEEGTAAMAISNSHAGRWQIGPAELWEHAVNNVRQLLPAEFFTMNHALKEIMNGSADCTEHAENLLLSTAGNSDGMYVLSNKSRSYGAACMAYPHILEMIGQIICKDFYILPSSIHEVIIVPYHYAFGSFEMESMVREINRTQVADEEVLSDRVYYYDRAAGKLFFGTEYAPAEMMG